MYVQEVNEYNKTRTTLLKYINTVLKRRPKSYQEIKTPTNKIVKLDGRPSNQ